MVPGVYTIAFEFSDQAGNAAQSLTRTVTVVDTTAPVIGLSGASAVTLEAGTAYLDAGATWTDLVDGNGTFNGTGEVNSMVPGVYTIAFEFSDQAGNTAQSLTRTVTVYNDAPNGLTLSTNRVEENLPGGTAVGNFSVSDPNDPEGKGTYVFELLEAGMPPSFALESNGSHVDPAP